MNRRTLLAAALGGLFALGPQAHTPTTADGGFTALPTALLGAADAYGATATLWVDVTYNWDRSEFLIVFAAQNGVDAAVWDIRARRFRHDGEPIGASFVVSTGHFDIDPHVAHDLHTNRYLVVWTRVLPDGSSGSVIARLLDSSGTVLGSEIAISNPAVSAGQPDVAARNFREQSGVLTAFVVVWKQTISSGGNIVKRERVSGDGLPLNEATLSENPTTSVDRNPRIAYNPVDDRFLVVWSDDGVVRGRTVRASGAHGSEFTISTGHGEEPSVAFDLASRRYLVAWSGQDATLTQFDLTGQFLTPGGMPAPIGGNVLLHPPAPLGMGPHRPDVTSDMGTFVVAYEDRAAAVDEARYLRVTPGGVVTSDARLDRDPVLGPMVATSVHGDLFAAYTAVNPAATSVDVRVAHGGRWTAHYVHGPTGDYDQDGRADLFLFRPSTGEWHVQTQSGDVSYIVGAAGDTPVLLDWDGDGLVDLGTFRPSSGGWRIRLTTPRTVSTVVFGLGGDVPVPGDYLGDARTEIAVFRPSTATWMIRENGSATTTSVAFGQIGDVPVPADYDGDGKTELAVWRPCTGTWHTSELNGTGQTQVTFGQPGDTPLQGNFVGSVHADQVVFRPQERRWYRRDGLKGVTSSVLQNAAGQPMPLDYDGDGLLNPVLFDWKLGRWTIRLSTKDIVVPFGTALDIPAGSR